MNNAVKLWLIAAVLIVSAATAFAHGTEHPGLDTLDVSDPSQILAVSGDAIPGLTVDVGRASDGGWDFSVTLVNFEILEGDAPADGTGNTGHVHLFVNGEFVARIDGAVGHVGPSDAYIYDVAVALISHDDRFLAEDGQLVMEQFVILEPRSNPDEASPISIIDVTVADGEDAPTAQVSRGDLVVFRWKVESPMDLHLHGYDVAAEATPATKMTMVFFAEFAGRFPVEAHAGGVDRPVFFLEVLP